MKIHDLEVTGSLIYNGVNLLSLTSSVTDSGSFSAQIVNLNQVSSSLNSFTSSINTTIKNKLDSESVISGSAQVLITGTTGYSTFSSSISNSIGDLSSSVGSLSSSIATTTSNLSSRIGSVETKTGSYATTGSNIFVGSQVITGSICSTGDIVTTGQIVAQTINVQQVTSSIVYSCGSNIFGNILSNTQQFTGSILATGSLTISGPLSATTIYGSTAVCSTVGKFSTCIDAGSGTFSGALQGDYLVVGTTAASSGGVRLGTQVAIRARNVANTANIPLIESSATDKVSIDSGGAGTVLGGTLSGTSATFSSTTADYAITITNVQDSSQGLLIRATDNDTSLHLLNLQSSNGATSQTWVDRFAVTKGGNVGIGTSSPDPYGFGYTSLTIKGGTYAGAAGMLHLITPTTDTNGQILGQINFNDGVNLGAVISSRRETSNTTSNIQFYTNNCTITERMRITSAGNTEIRGGNILNIYRTDNTRALQLYTTSNETVIDSWEATSEPLHIRSNGTGGRIQFFTCSTERMRIASGGNVLIGTTSSGNPSSGRGLVTLNGASNVMYELAVGGSEYGYVYHGGSNGNMYLNNSRSNATTYVVSYNNGVYLGISATSWTSNSDERLKNITGTIENAIESLQTLRTVKHTWKSDNTNKEHLALIAQDVEQVFPQVIDKSKLPSNPKEEQIDETEYLGVRYTELIPVLVKAIQEQQSTICSQSQKIAILESCLGIM